MKNIFYAFVIFIFALSLSGCGMSLSGPQGPDSGDEIDLSEEPQGPDSGEEADPNEPQGPDSGEEIDTNQEPNSPDSGEEADTSDEPSSPDSGEDDTSDEPNSPDSGEEIDTSEDDDDDDGDAPTSPDSGEEEDTTDPDKEAADEEIDEELSGGYGSCDSIDDASICVTYSGSYWKDAKNMTLHCQGGGTFSTKPCPSDMLGGCKVGAGTPNENIIWHYGRGGDPFTEVIGYSAMACKAIPGSAWISR